MRHGERRPAELAHRDGTAAPINLVLIGHVGVTRELNRVRKELAASLDP